MNRVSNKLDRISEAKEENENENKEHMMMLKNIEDINSLINHKGKPDKRKLMLLK